MNISLMIPLVAAALAWVAYLVVVVRADGHGHRPPPRSHRDEERPRHGAPL